MRFTAEQIFLTDREGKPLDDRATAYHIVEADTLDAALSSFLLKQEAEVIGAIQRFHGAQAMVTAHQGPEVFTVHLMPGSDAFPRELKRPSSQRAGEADQPAREERREERDR